MASHPPPFGGGYGDERGDPGAFVVEDLTQGLNEWRNIQDIVRLSFVAFHKALQAQGDAIQALTEQTELRALKSDVRAAFETHEELLEVRLGEAEAADAGDAETPNAEIRDAEILERVAALERRAETVETRLDRFATKAELEKASEETRMKLDALLRDLRRDNGGDADARRDARATVHSPPPRDDAVRTAFESSSPRRASRAGKETRAESSRDERYEDTGKTHASDEPSDGGVETAETARRVAEMRVALASKADAAEVRETLTRKADSRDERYEDTGKTHARDEPSDGGVETARRVAEMRVALASKADAAEVRETLTRKADADAVAAALERLERAASTYATKADLHSVNVSTVTASDLAALAAEKVGVDEVNRALAEVSAALDEKAGAAALDAFARESRMALRGVAAETSLSVARWIWKSGRTKAHGLVPWNVQSVNTDPENFRWERDKTFVRAGAPGLYEVTFGFFARRKPAVRLLVDGEPVLAAVNSASYVTHHSSGRLTSATRHPAGNVTGLTLIDFLALPAKAKVAVAYEGETGAEGFLSLKKL